MAHIRAFSVRSIVTLSEDPRIKIESIYGYGDKLLLGFSNGGLLVFTVNDPFSPELDASLTHTFQTFCRKSIDRIGVIKDASALLILSEGAVHVFDLESFQLMEQLQHTKGATTFEVIDGIRENEDGFQSMVSKLAVGCKRKLIIYEWKDSEFASHREIQLADRIRTIAFIDHSKVVCGLGSEFAVVDIENETVINTIVAGSDTGNSFTSVGMSYVGIGSKLPMPLSVRLGEKEGQVMIVRENACQVVGVDGQLKGTEVKEFESAPTILGYSYPYLIMINNGQIEIRNAETTTLLQSIEMQEATCMNSGKLLYVATHNQVMRLLTDDYATQIKCLAASNQLLEAISLINQIEPVLIKDKENMLRDLLLLRAIEMFKNREFEDALQLFSDISAPPNIVIALYPESISGDLAVKEDLVTELDPVPDPNATWQTQPHPEHIEELQQQKLPTELPEPVPVAIELSDEEFKLAVRKLQEYLSDTRRRIAKLRDTNEKIEFQGFELSERIYGDLHSAAVLVDTTLFKCYIHISRALVGPLVRVNNYCDPAVVKEQLEELGKWKELVDFYYNKGMHREALTLLRELADDEESLLDGPEPTIRYLQRLDNSNINLIFEFAKWPLQVDRELAKDVFMEDSRESLSLARNLVLKYLQKISDQTYYLPIIYLEYLTGQMGDSSPTTHNNLGLMYIKSIANGDPEDRLSIFLDFVKNNNKYRPDRLLLETPLKQAEFAEPRAVMHGKRGEHKKALEIYAFEIGSAAQAREYCSELYLKDPELGKQYLHVLLSLYLSRKKDYNEKAVLELLSSQGSRMSVDDVIQNLPPDTRVHDINSFLQSHIRSLHSSVKTSQLDEAMRRVHLVRTQEQLLELGQKHALITNLRTCKVCTKRLGHSVISMFPNGDVVHYGCAKQYQQTQEQQKDKLKTVRVSNYL